MSPGFNHRMLILAREARGVTQKELAQGIRITQGRISKIENGLLDMPHDLLQATAEYLQYPVSFFIQEDPIYGAPVRYHRKRQSVGQKDLAKFHARLNVVRLQLSRLLTSVDLTSKNQIPRLDVDEYGGDAASVARAVRGGWMLARGPVSNMIGCLEDAGGIVIPFDFEDQAIDAIGMRIPGDTSFPALFFINATCPGDRMRFTLAHELGHLVMHQFPHERMEEEADRFAAEFLMPESDIKPYFSSVSLSRMVQLKPYWKTSVAALIEHAHSLGCISGWKRTQLWKEWSALGYRKNEPLPLPPEEPRTLKELIDVHLSELGYSIAELAQVIHCNDYEFQATYLPEKRFRVISGGRA